MDAVLDRLLGHRLGALALRERGRSLALREPVDVVVVHEVGEVEVAAAGVHEVAGADAVPVTVAAEREHREARVRKTPAGGDREHATVQRVEAIRVHVMRRLPRAADAREQRDLVGIELQLRERHLDPGQNSEIAAARTPIVVELGLVVLDRELHRRANGHASPPARPCPRAPS